MTLIKKPHNNPFAEADSTQVDFTTNRNSKMIQALLSPDANGLFLFYLDKKGTNFLIPPGLSPEEVEELKVEFQMLFERFAKKANNGRGNNG